MQPPVVSLDTGRASAGAHLSVDSNPSAMPLHDQFGRSLAWTAVLSDSCQQLLMAGDFQTATDNAASMLADFLGLSHSMVLRLVAAGNPPALLLQAGQGWKPGMINQARFECDIGTFAGYTMRSAEPVTIEDVAQEQRFAFPPALSGYGFVSGAGVRIPFPDESPGVLAVFSTEPRLFCEGDIFCLRLMATLLAAFAGRQRAGDDRAGDREKIAQAKLEWEATVDALPHFICLLDRERRIMRANRSVESWIPGQTVDVRGHTIHALLHPGCEDEDCHLATCCDFAWEELRNGNAFEYEVEDRILKRHLNIQLRPTAQRHKSGESHGSFAVALIHDISNIKRAEDLMKMSNDLLEQRIQARTAELMQANLRLTQEIEERNRIEESLRSSEGEMRLMSAQLLTAQEVERKRIAAELHDGIGQSLSAIKFNLENAIGLWASRCSAEEARQLDNIIVMMRGAVEEVRRISMDLHPSTLTDLGILPTVAWFCREFRAIYSSIRLDTHIGLEEADVPTPLKTVVFRIMQEALNNIVKHAKATAVRLHLRKNAATIELLIEDNGRGFDTGLLAQHDRPDRGFGVSSMKERTEFSGGNFSIWSATNAGTVVHASWPTHL